MEFLNGFRRRILTAVVLGLAFLGSVQPDLTSDRTALVGFRAAMGGRPRLEWNLSDESPCSWAGVSCDRNRVFELRLPAMGLSGELPLGLGNLTQLQTLSLRFNALSGKVPADFANLLGLRNLYLQGNLFSGEIPAFLFDLRNLVRLNMADNNFSGEILSGFNNLSRLATLYLQNNQFTGMVPDLNLSLGQFNVSFNRLNGSIPSKLSGFPASSFEGNLLCGAPLLLCNSTPAAPGSKSKLSGGAIAGIVIGGLFVLVLILVVLILVCQRKSKRKSESRERVRSSGSVVEVLGEKTATAGNSESVSIDHLTAGKSSSAAGKDKRLVFFGNVGNVFDLEDLLRASAEVLGKGTFGTAYKATLETGMVIAVKRMKEMTAMEKEFREKMEEVGRMKHENLVSLRAYYYSREEKLLVYDYMPMGSLSALLHGSKESGRSPLNWEARCGIALGVAHGIHYLHSQDPTISHGNIKSSNILLTRSYDACVSDFGLSQLAMSPSAPSRVAGYRAPEVTDSRKVSQKADIYSFGVLLLEMLTGKAPISHSISNEEGVDLPRWVQSVVQEEWTAEVFDEQLLRYQNVEEEMVQLLELALQCTVSYPDNRPQMDDVVRRIEELCRTTSLKQIEAIDDVVDDDDGNNGDSAG